MRLETVGKQLEKIGELDVTGGNGSNARKREKCQADGTDDVRQMGFVLKTGKYGTKNDFRIENGWWMRKILKIVNK